MSCTLINPEDARLFPQLYAVTLNNYWDHVYLTFNTDDQSALDTVVDYIEEELKEAGTDPEECSYFYSNEEAERLEKEDGYSFIVAGNYCRNLNAEHTQIHTEIGPAIRKVAAELVKKYEAAEDVK